ncbi:MAG: lysophospholipid acyltransferase family protein [Candidatus Cyclobacteriaceae bacterium M2_1C_046]
MYIIVKLLSFLPLRLLYGFSDFLFILIYKGFSYRLNIVRANLQKALPERSAQERKEIERRFYRNFCDFIVETIKGVSLKKEQVTERVVFTNLDDIKRYLSQGRPVLMLASHQFNWEWMQLSAAVQFPIGIDYIYHPLHNKSSDQLMLKMRGRFGAEPVKRSAVGRQVIRRRNESRAYALVADQLPRNRDKKVWVDFLNIETAFFQGIAQIAHLIDGPVAYFHLVKKHRGYYEATMIKLFDDPKKESEEDIVQSYAHAVEANIKEQPEGWLWSHKRWKRNKNQFVA